MSKRKSLNENAQNVIFEIREKDSLEMISKLNYETLAKLKKVFGFGINPEDLLKVVNYRLENFDEPIPESYGLREQKVAHMKIVLTNVVMDANFWKQWGLKDELKDGLLKVMDNEDQALVYADEKMRTLMESHALLSKSSKRLVFLYGTRTKEQNARTAKAVGKLFDGIDASFKNMSIVVLGTEDNNFETMMSGYTITASNKLVVSKAARVLHASSTKADTVLDLISCDLRISGHGLSGNLKLKTDVTAVELKQSAE
jgi:hypothetical protein